MVSRVSTGLFVATHGACLLVFVVGFSWKLVALAAAGYAIRMWAVTAGYHRYFAHRTYKTSRAFQLVLAWLGASAMQNGPLWWASNHRRHHKYSDGPLDPHSPLRGFWHAHCGWFQKDVDVDLSNVSDLAAYPELRFIEKRHWLPVLSYIAICAAIGGVPGIVWGFAVSTVACNQVTMAINSVAHIWGARRYETGDTSRNNAVLALLTLGEGWHNNHHHFQSSTRQGFRWWELDVTYWSLRLLALLGVVWGIREPTKAALAGPLVVRKSTARALSVSGRWRPRRTPGG
jgi:stearoyl-CoA desaturase (delta-9 desaturase)